MEVAEALGTDDSLRPLTGHKLIEQPEVERTAVVIDIRADTIFLGLPLIVVMMVVMVPMLIMVVVMLMLIVVIIVMMVVMFVFFFLFFVFVMMLLHFLDPLGGGGYSIEVKHIGVDNLVKIDITKVTVDNLCLWLQLAYNATHPPQFIGCHLGSLIEQYDVAELDLLNYEVLYVFLVDVLLHQIEAASKLVAHTEGIHHGDDTVEAWNPLLCHLWSHLWNRANGLRYWSRFADAAGLDDDIVEAVEGDDVLQLLYEVHLQRTTDTAVLKGHERVVLLVHDAALLDQTGIDVHLADVVHDDGKLDAALVCQYSI